ncbi:MAG: GatB/YqeY domain-containing protein [Bacteroidetes bacterium]|jgi:uncharacterized protein|nr:GatB/YqeY domain-containing protein [Bacteroidota bacterium]MBT6685078.1 GatB/YqeY domain-containing protein [Bacteroidota bacterium]MBT7142618.1 GatB/YqeY domain-containing protein [Bacteroidota bacterium]MBT7493543.1 GatB/YqeY domain-containing protein [Bacteroidota bacterium]
MSLVEKISADIKTAMKAKEKEKLTAIRAVKSALLLANTEKGADGEMSEDAEIKLLQKLVKQRKESAELYKSQNREDLYEQEIFEASVIEKYLPEQMSEEEIEEIIKQIIAELGASSMKDMGKVMGATNKKLAGKAEGRIIAAKVKELLK